MKTRLKLHDELVIWPERKPVEQVLALKGVTPRAIWESTYQQNDAVSFGSIFPRSWWNYYQLQGMHLPPVYEVDLEGNSVECKLVTLPLRFATQMQSWDLAFSEKKTAAYNVGQVWGKTGANSYLLQMIRGHWDMPELVRQVEGLANKYPLARPILIENKANGPAVIQTLRKRVPGILPVEPHTDKLSRAHAVTPFVEAGNIFLPHPSLAEYVKIFIDELSTFPASAYKDVTDTMSQVLFRLYNITTGRKGARAGSVVTN